MLSKFSVRKPMTVFVSVVVVLVLGIVSFTRMTPDLLPNMDFPYVIIMTTYGGQTPETVETVVSKPLEQALSVVDGVKTVTSQSAENYSVIMIEFEDGTNMDSATVDVRSGLDAVSDLWPDEVGAPYLIKVNPNILPVAMAAVDFEGKDRQEISDFVSSELMNKIEGIDGVASVSDKGIVIEKENIVLSQDKIDRLNEKIAAALDDQFADAEDKLSEAQEQINDNIEQAKDGSQTISDSMDEINAQQEALAKQLAQAQNEAENGSTKLLSAKMELLDQKSALTQTKQLLETSYQALLKFKETYNDLLEQKQKAVSRLDFLNDISDRYKELLGQLASSDLTEEGIAELNSQLAKIDEQLEPYGIKKEDLVQTITAAENAIDKIDSSIENVNASLKDFGTDTSLLDKTLESITSQIAQINSGIEQIDKALEGLDDKSMTVNEALATISEQQSGADFKMGAALSALTTKQSELQSAVAQLEGAKKELDSSLEELSEKKSEAKDKADMNNTVTLETIAGILTAQNFSMPAGYVTDDDNNKLMVRVGDKLPDEKSLETLALFDTSIDGIGVVELGDVADIFVADNSDELYAKINGRDGVILSFSKQSNIATSTVSDNIRNELKALEEKYEGLSFTTLYNQGDYINIIVGSVLQNLLMGAVLAIIILFFFLRDIKPTIIIAVSIPISLIFAIVLMYFSSISLNVISLSGLAIGVGMLVDNSVVVIENIFRLRGLGHPPIKAAMNGARQVAGAIVASTLTTISVFLPIVFVEGVTRQLFVDMALTIAYSLLASLIVALTLVPAMSGKMLRKIKPQKDSSKSKILIAYEKSLRFTLRHRLLTLLLVIALLFGSGFAALARGFSFMPDMSSTEVQVSVKLDGNATFDDTVEVANRISEAMVKYDEFETVGVTTGSESSLMGISAGGASAEAGSITAYGVLKQDSIKQGKRISEELKDEFADIKGDVEIGSGSMSSMSTLIGDGSVTVKIFGEELDDLRTAAQTAAEKLENVEGVDEVDNGLSESSPEIRVSVDKLKAAEKGLTVAQVFQQVAAAVSGEKTSTTLKTSDGKDIDIVVVKDEAQKISSDDVSDISIKYTDKEGKEKNTSLSSIADISRGETMEVIKRENQKRFVTLSATVAENSSLTHATNNAKAAFEELELPAGCTYSFEGSDKMTMDALYQLMLMMLIGVILIYLIMAAQFQSLKSPFIIMFTIPLAFTGGFIALLLTGFDVSVISLLGFIMLCGIIVNNGIVLVDYINNLRIEGKERREAIVEAGKTRMRPILITALTTVLGLSVMALGIGTGAEMMQPLAIVCIGGLVYATIMTLYVIPVIYDLLNKKEIKTVSESDLEQTED